MNKLTKSAVYISKHISLFKCPICNSPMEIQSLKSLTCPNRHTFDIAKQGYLNLMTHPIKTNYGRKLFDARRRVIVESDFFRPFHSSIAKMIHKHIGKNKLSIVDMDCGEGSHLYHISNELQANFNQTVTGIGLDISKEGILEAAKHYENNIWMVADLANTPLNDHTVDVILNILSPSNYAEFGRLSKDNGLIVKAVPRKNYLIELRKYFHGNTEKRDYSNEKVIELFKDKFELVDQSVIHYTSHLDTTTLQALVKMTPLTWGIEDRVMARFLEKGIQNITVDLDMIIGRKKSE